MQQCWTNVLTPKRFHILIYCVLIFFLFVYLIDFSPPKFLRSSRWSESSMVLHSDIPCMPRKNIVFLKTHKCASSSIQNILLRYAHQRNLTVVVPVLPKYHFLSFSSRFQQELVNNAPWRMLGYNILCHHTVFSKKAIEMIMPEDSVYISILRNPVELFESLYEYSDLQEFYKMDIEEYARGTKNSSIAIKLRNRSNGMGRNQMLYDFGVHPRFFNNRPMIEKEIINIENYFDFIMIAENFDESIILLRHIFCWDLDDVISFTVNARMTPYKKKLSKEATKNLQDWNWGDKLLYEYFLQKFQKAIEEFGRERMATEVEELKKRREVWFNYCIEKQVASKNLTSYKIWSEKVTGYVLKSGMENKTCEDLVKPEKFFTNEIRQHQILESIAKGAKIPNYGPMSLRHIIDFTGLKGKELQDTKNLLRNQYNYRRGRLRAKG